MAGHSHWAGIKHKKAANDAKKGKVFSKLAKLIYSAVKEGGGGNPDDNPRLRLVLDKCRAANMPKDNIQRAIDKAMDPGGGYEPMSIEGYGAGGVAVIAECLTDNTNRTGPEVRKIFEKMNAKVGTPGCVAYMFNRRGLLQIEKEAAGEETVMETALEAGAEDVVDQGDFFEVTCDPSEIGTVEAAFEAADIPVQESSVKLVSDQLVEVDAETARKLMRLIDALEEHDDVSDVYTNFDVSAETADALAAE